MSQTPRGPDQFDNEHSSTSQSRIVKWIDEGLEPIHDLKRPDLDGLMERIGDARVVLLGESTHGTAEFYDLRAEITLRLAKEKGFRIIGLEADWPDVSEVNEYVQGRRGHWDGFHRFPQWMWRNQSFSRFVHRLRDLNASEQRASASIYGLDLYSLSSSLYEVMSFLEKHDPEAAERARQASTCLDPYHFDPQFYGMAVWRDETKSCEEDVLEVLRIMHERNLRSLEASNTELLSALQNARVLKNAEEYYRTMGSGAVDSWNLRDQHMFESLLVLLDHYGPDSKAVIWEHNSHLGNAQATYMRRAGKFNVGQLCKSKFDTSCYSIGFMSDHGTVAAADDWDGDVQFKKLRPSRPDSFEYLLNEAKEPNYFLPLRDQKPELQDALRKTRLERAVGVIYRPESERLSHYFDAQLTDQFDEICWLAETNAVTPLYHVAETEESDLYPTGL